MDQDKESGIRGRVAKALLQLARVPAKAWIVLGFFLSAALLMALHTAVVAKNATLRLKVQHGFRTAQLSVSVDEDQVYSGKLVGTVRKRFGLIPEAVQGTLSETLPVSAGNHQVRVRIAAEDGSVQEDTITGDFVRNGQRTLSIVARRNDVSLNWQSASGAGSESAANVSPGSSSPQPGWTERYAGTLLLTAAGSIISALTGFALKELPKQLTRRPSPSAEN